MDTGAEPAHTIVTGIGPFPGVPDNPCAALLAALRGTPEPLPPATLCHLLPVGYEQVQAALDAIMAEPPAVLLLTGYSAAATGLRVETRAHDHCSPDHADAFGRRPGVELAAMARAYLEPAPADLAAIVARVREAGVACALSDDAGAYVCNHLYFHALERIAATGCTTAAVFVHVPAIAGSPLAATSAGAMPLATMGRGVALIAAALAEHAGLAQPCGKHRAISGSVAKS